MDAGVINFAVYENGKEYLGLAQLTFGSASNKRITVNGAGIPGDIDIPVPGHRDAMTVTLNFTDAPEAGYKLRAQRVHDLDCRAAHEAYDPVSGVLKVVAYKHLLRVIPASQDDGTTAPATPQGASQELVVLSRTDFIDGKQVWKYDPVNFQDIDADGVDHLAAVRSALGK